MSGSGSASPERTASRRSGSIPRPVSVTDMTTSSGLTVHVKAIQPESVYLRALSAKFPSTRKRSDRDKGSLQDGPDTRRLKTTPFERAAARYGSNAELNSRMMAARSHSGESDFSGSSSMDSTISSNSLLDLPSMSKY